MSEVAFIEKRYKKLETGDRLPEYSRVVVEVTDEISYSAGSEVGKTLTVVNPWGTQQMADFMLESIQGYRYEPFTAKGTVLDPAAELGDGVDIGSVRGGLYTATLNFGHRYSGDVSAPHEEEIDNEYPYKPSSDRKITRKISGLAKEVSSQFSIQAGLIAAKVSRIGENNDATFGWELDEESWTIKANNQNVLQATKEGLEVYGIIRATGGTIGGFTISSDHLSLNGQTWGGDVANGGYIGTQGIQMGKYFKVDSMGNLYAYSGTFQGSVFAGNVVYGEDAGYFSGNGLAYGSITGNRLVGNTVTSDYTSYGINASLSYADFANGVFNGWNEAAAIKVHSAAVGNLGIGGYDCILGTIVVNGITHKVVKWGEL